MKKNIEFWCQENKYNNPIYIYIVWKKSGSVEKQTQLKIKWLVLYNVTYICMFQLALNETWQG
jgi:hypothetical protein